MEERALSYFRIKTECVVELPTGALGKKKIEELVLASTYTEAETIANQIIEEENRTQFGSVSYEILKTKINDIIYNDILATEKNIVPGFCCNYFAELENSGVGLYVVKVMFFTTDGETGKDKISQVDYYIPALSNADANSKINEFLADSIDDFVIRAVKFDKAEAIYWPLDEYNRKITRFKTE